MIIIPINDREKMGVDHIGIVGFMDKMNHVFEVVVLAATLLTAVFVVYV